MLIALAPSGRIVAVHGGHSVVIMPGKMVLNGHYAVEPEALPARGTSGSTLTCQGIMP
jgi:hypothetical protein